MNIYKTMGENRAKYLKKEIASNKVNSKISKLTETDLGEIVGDETLVKLLENGIGTKEALKEVGEEKLKGMNINIFSLKAIKKFLTNKKNNG